MTKHKRKIFLLILAVLVLIGNLFLLASCKESDEKIKALEFGDSDWQQDSLSDTDKLLWDVTLTNKEIYNVKSISVTLRLYQDSSFVETKTFVFETSVRHAGKFDGTLTFEMPSAIDRVVVDTWDLNYDTLWGTYWIWFVATIAATVVLAAIYCVVIIVKDVGLHDIADSLLDVINDHVWVAVLFCLPFCAVLCLFIFSYWVPALIVLGGIVSFVLLALLGHLIRFIKEKAGQNRRRNAYYNKATISHEVKVSDKVVRDNTIRDTSAKSTNTTITPSSPTHTPPTSSSNDDIGNNSSTITTNNRVVSTTYEFPRTNSGTTISTPTSGYGSRVSSTPSKVPTNSSSGSSSPTNSRNSGSSTPTNSRSSNNSPTNDRKVSNPVKSNDTTPVKADDNYPTN